MVATFSEAIRDAVPCQEEVPLSPVLSQGEAASTVLPASGS